MCKNSIKFHNFKSYSYQEQTEGTSPMMSQQPTRLGTVLILAAQAER